MHPQSSQSTHPTAGWELVNGPAQLRTVRPRVAKVLQSTSPRLPLGPILNNGFHDDDTSAFSSSNHPENRARRSTAVISGDVSGSGLRSNPNYRFSPRPQRARAPLWAVGLLAKVTPLISSFSSRYPSYRMFFFFFFFQTPRPCKALSVVLFTSVLKCNLENDVTETLG